MLHSEVPDLLHPAAVLERRAKELGYRLDPAASVVFTASVDRTGKPVTETYIVGGQSITGTYSARHARLKISRDGRSLWEASGCNHPGHIVMFPAHVDRKEYLSGFGAPDYTLFKERPLPGVIRAVGGKQEPLGQSTLAASGLR